jgi:hypothetical protein
LPIRQANVAKGVVKTLRHGARRALCKKAQAMAADFRCHINSEFITHSITLI